ncbi:hypothetical protein BJ165DRAFT_995302 [Panaeolus papilionaceus]|nr:hypothetical protein BJ165DRAFT_995302 [Panaeolus papilionaceus]
MKGTTKGSSDSINDSNTQKTLERDDLFYDEFVVFKVENTLFSVPKKGLVQPGTYFETLFQEKAAGSEGDLDQDNESDDATVAEQKLGISDENPIVLEGVKKEAFRDFLRVIYPHNAAGPYEDDEWINVLHLAHKWNFPSIKEEAVKRIEHLFFFEENDILEALALCRKYDIQNWLINM